MKFQIQELITKTLQKIFLNADQKPVSVSVFATVTNEGNETTLYFPKIELKRYLGK